MNIARKFGCPSFADVARAVRSAVARSRISMERRDGAQWTDVCIDVLATHAPHHEGGPIDPLELVQRQLLYGEKMIHAFVGRTHADSQAIDQYHAGVGAGFHGEDRTAEPRSFEPLADSAWRSDQLRRLRHIGLRHGAVCRRLHQGIHVEPSVQGGCTRSEPGTLHRGTDR